MSDPRTQANPATKARFSSRLALLLSVLGIAVGTGNIWRFPRIAAQNAGADGAGAFLIAWLIFLFAWSIPLIIAEYAIGQTGRKGVVGTFAKLSGGRLTWMGGFVTLVSTAIMFYYAVVAGWCMYYFAISLFGGVPATLAEAQGGWELFQDSAWPLILLALAFGLGGLACSRGVKSIERVTTILLPVLLTIVVISVVRAVTLEGAMDGVRYLFTPTWSDFSKPSLWLEALTQNAWDTGAGWGLILTYGAYMKREHGVVRNAVLTGVGNNTVSILSGVMIFGTVFAVLGTTMGRPEILEVMQTSGPAGTGLTFIWMPQLFAQMPFGRILVILFFLGLAFASFTSLISMIEMVTRTFVDFGVARGKAILIIVGLGFLFGFPSAVNLDFFGNQDFVWGVALMISGAFVAFLVIRFGADRLREVVATPTDWSLPGTWNVLMKFLVPLEAAALLLWWMGLATTSEYTAAWWNPLEPFSLMTCLVQWGVALVALIALNGWMSRQIDLQHTMKTEMMP